LTAASPFGIIVTPCDLAGGDLILSRSA